MGIACQVLPMSDTFVETKIQTDTHGELDFQEYFVRYRWQPKILNVRFANVEQAQVSPQVQQAIEEADVLILAPSNPYLSINPILSVGNMRDLLMSRDIPRIAVSPIVSGKAIKGPAAKMMSELGLEVSPRQVAREYSNLLNGFVYDVQDSPLNFPTLNSVAFDTIMTTDTDKARLARDILTWLESW
jgi:LPPG:FO 2-phospho-L-lactate transferase